ncbi:hypothetical protein PVAP13_2NG224300 [Panicum virgatum]|uniref:Uncharacterized protein n=1 Tax=Panicum virgatum TaxID=38727 RepID=A0A8T0VGQ2_PANVG|nr:hypothetical protein PVAP13_2NG224300 [Panicum virgatum]
MALSWCHGRARHAHTALRSQGHARAFPSPLASPPWLRRASCPRVSAPPPLRRGLRSCPASAPSLDLDPMCHREASQSWTTAAPRNRGRGKREEKKGGKRKEGWKNRCRR